MAVAQASAATNEALGDVNRQYWNENVHLIDKEQWIQNLGRQIVDFLQNHIDWVGIPLGDAADKKAGIRLLDYACGSGLVTYALLPWFSVIRGIDVSDKMVDAYNKSAHSQGISAERVHALQGDLTVPNVWLASRDLFGFDVIAISMALHHIDGPEKFLPKLLARLNEGGSLLLIDWTPEHYGVLEKPSPAHSHQSSHSNTRAVLSDHPATHTMSRAGFSEGEMVGMMVDAGFIQVEYRLYHERSSMGEEIGGARQVFFARGKRPVSQ